MSKKTHSTSVSIEELYQQRKAEHVTPEHLTKTLMTQHKNKRRTKHWHLALPAAMASLFVVLVIWPNRTDFDTHKVSVDSMQYSVATEAQLEEIQIEQDYSTMADSSMAEAEVLSLAPAPSARAAKIVAPAAKEQIQQKLNTIDKSTEVLETEPSTTKTLASTNADKPKTLRLEVMNGEKGLFRNCTGADVTLPIKTTLQHWVTATEIAPNEWQLEPLAENPCDVDQ